MSTEPHTLFFSDQCDYCGIMIKMIEDGGISGEFKKVDVHRETIDLSRIKAVPTLIVDHQQMMVGKQAFAWLQNKVEKTVHPHSYSMSKGGFDSMSCPFSYIEEGGSDGIRNSGVSCMWSDANFGGGESKTEPADEKKTEKARMMDDAYTRLQADRDAMMPQTNHIRT